MSNGTRPTEPQALKRSSQRCWDTQLGYRKQSDITIFVRLDRHIRYSVWIELTCLSLRCFFKYSGTVFFRYQCSSQ